MSTADRPVSEPAAETWSRQEPIIRRFEDAWRRGERPVIEEYLPTDGPARRVLLVELVHAELECCLKAGETARAEEYLQRFPELADDAVAAVELILAEHELRCRREGPLAFADYARRFPAHQEALRQRRREPAGGTTALAADLVPPETVSLVRKAAPPPTAIPQVDGDRSAPATGLPAVQGYELLGKLGQGGMGVVYKARQLRADRLVAVKMIRGGDDTEPEYLARFRTEAEAAARLQHPSIVQIYEVGEHDGLPFFSLELVEGGSLRERLDEGPLPVCEAAALVQTLAGAMAAAHQRGVLHRDLKPGNVLLAADGTPKVTDFGLAKKLDDPSGQTQSGAVVGTPSYMAPEQAAGKSKDIGPAADVYALGAVLYECLTGRPPFRGPTTWETLAQVLSEEPVPVRQLQPTVPRDLETICLKCLQKEPGKRYASAGALAADLDRFLAGAPVLARPVGGLERALRWARRHPTAAALVLTSGVLLLLLVAGAVALWFDAQVRDLNAQLNGALQETEQQRDEARGQRAEAERQKGAAEAARAGEEEQRKQAEAARAGETEQRARAQGLLYLMRIERAHSAWRENDVRRADDILETCGAEQRGHWEWRYLWRLCHSDLLTLKGHTANVNSVAFSPDGSRLASASADGSVKVWDQTGHEVLTLAANPWQVYEVVWSPDGKRLASASVDGTVRAWDAQTGKQALTLTGHTNWVWGVAWSPDGTRLASAADDRTVRVWDATTGQEALRLKGHTSAVSGVAWSPDGTRLASAAEQFDAQRKEFNGELKLWDARTGQQALTLKGAGLHVTFSPDGSRLASASGDRTIRVWDAATGVELLSLKGAGNCLAFSPDGTHLASTGGDLTVKVWDAKSGQLGLSLRAPAAVMDLAWSPDGRHLASGGGNLDMPGDVKLWDARTGQEVLSLEGHTNWVRGIAWSSDGTRLVSGSEDRTVRVWDVNSGQEALTLKGHTALVYGVAWSPDGRRLASASGDLTVRIWDAGPTGGPPGAP
jgi:WD40 repeat protein